MHNQSLQYKLRIKAVTFVRGAVSKAKVSFIKERGDHMQGRWGLANKNGPKIYILKYKREIIYVGITKSLLSSRLGSGLSASGKKGYHGYKWKELAKKGESDVIDLFVYLFKNEERTEAIEAEVVYLIRGRTGKWPKYQTEIHFHQSNNEERMGAEKIYGQIEKVLIK